MNQLHLPFLELSILIPAIGALLISGLKSPNAARKWCLVCSGFTFACTVLAWQDFGLLHMNEASDRWDLIATLTGYQLFVVDEFSAPLLPAVALLYFLMTLATLKTKMQRFSFSWSLASESARLATLACRDPWAVIAFLALGCIPPLFELKSRQRQLRIYGLHMGLSIALLVIGWFLVGLEPDQKLHSLWAIVPIMIAIAIRSGMVPFHLWMGDLFEHGSFGSALLFVTPMMGAYATVRLLLPVAPDWVLRGLGVLAMSTAVYAAGLSMIQHEARRFFCYSFLSHSSMIFVGLDAVTPIGLTGALCMWLSIMLSMTGLGLTLRALEARFGRLSLDRYHGLYEHTPGLAMCFALTGLASVGFPGTLGFIGTELLIDGAVETYASVGVMLLLATALNGIAIVRAYFLLFTGSRYASSVSLKIGIRERFAVLLLAALLIGGGLFPQPGVLTRHHAARQLLEHRRVMLGLPPLPDEAHEHGGGAEPAGQPGPVDGVEPAARQE